MRELPHVDFRRQVPPDRRLERLVGREPPAGEGPGAGEGLACPLPQERGELAGAHLQHDREDGLSRECGRLGQGLRLRVENLSGRHRRKAESDARHGTCVPARSTGSRGARRLRRLRRRRGGADDADAATGRRAQGRPDHRPRPARRQRLQRARVPRAPARGEGARRPGPRGRVGVGGRLHPEHELARARRLRPHHRGRLRPGRRDRQDREALPEDEVRDHRRRPGVRAGQAEERPGPALPRGGGRATSPASSPRCRRRGATGPTRSARSAGSRSRRSIVSSPATRRVRRRRRRASPCAGTTHRTGTTRPSARSSR